MNSTEIKFIALQKTIMAFMAASIGCSEFRAYTPDYTPDYTPYYNFEELAFNKETIRIYKNEWLNRVDYEEYSEKPISFWHNNQFRGIASYGSSEAYRITDSIKQEMKGEFLAHFLDLELIGLSKIKTRNGNYLIKDLAEKYTWYETPRGEFIRVANGLEEWGWAVEYWDATVEECGCTEEEIRNFEFEEIPISKGEKRSLKREKDISFKNRVQS